MAEPKTVMVVAGGEWQLPLIRTAKDMGFRVINTNRDEDSPGFAIADIGRVADVLDREANLAIAREYRPDAVVTDQSDIAVPTVAYLCEVLGLPGIGSAAAERFTDKSLMRACCREHGFPCPRYETCVDLADLQHFFDQGAGPVVIKPTNNQSSRGVLRVDTREALAAAWEEVIPFCRNGSVLAEAFIGGVELTVEGIKLPARHYSLAISVKEHFAHNPMVARRLYYAASHAGFDIEALKAQHDRFIEAMELPFGITHTEYKYQDGEFFLIETAARGGGTRVSSDIIPLMSGVDANALLLRLALGDDPGSVEPSGDPPCVVLEFFDFEAGTVASVSGLDQARGLEGITDIGLTFAPGDTLTPPSDDRSRHMHLIAYADTPGELQTRVDRVRETVEVHYV